MLLFLDLVDRWGRPVVAELTVRRETVEVRCRDRSGIADRDVLRRWLHAPEGVYAYDDLAWLRIGTGVALAVDDTVPAFPLTGHVLASLRERV